MAKRKTVNIKALVEKVNYMNRHSTCARQMRDGWNSLLESVLMESDTYNGFGYLLPSEVPNGHLPGMANGEDGAKSFPDDSRRYYYLKGGL